RLQCRVCELIARLAGARDGIPDALIAGGAVSGLARLAAAPDSPSAVRGRAGAALALLSRSPTGRRQLVTLARRLPDLMAALVAKRPPGSSRVIQREPTGISLATSAADLALADQAEADEMKAAESDGEGSEVMQRQPSVAKPVCKKYFEFKLIYSLGCQVLHRLTRRATFVAAVGCMLLVIILFSALKLTRRTEPRVVDLELSRRIAEQLRPDQDDLAAIGQHVFSAYFDTRATLGNRKYVRIVAVWISKPIESATFVFVQTGDAAQRSQVLRVRHNPLSLGKQPADQQQIINCVSVTFGNPNEHRLIEWLEAQRLLKMDKVELHFYHVLNKNFEAVAQSYSAEGFLNVRKIGCPFCDPADSDLKLLLMSPAINQCLYEYTAVFDLDEIIVPQQHPDFPPCGSLGEGQHQLFAFRNWYHFTSRTRSGSGCTCCESLPNERGEPDWLFGKVNPQILLVVALQNHFSWEDAPSRHEDEHLPRGCGHRGQRAYKKCHFYPNECKAMPQ
uniref:Glycosyltransferase family 92 protein n=1 Tax=Macrostomum lignano TaxID=282301 RepID=A0A1I8GQM4_9PLAT